MYEFGVIYEEIIRPVAFQTICNTKTGWHYNVLKISSENLTYMGRRKRRKANELVGRRKGSRGKGVW
jgi:hypothetical protein